MPQATCGRCNRTISGMNRNLNYDLVLLDWTGRQLPQGKRGATPAELAPILERLHVTGEGWLRLLLDYSRLFARSAGTPALLQPDADKWGRLRMAGISHTQAAFG
jgi:hypothetical protein